MGGEMAPLRLDEGSRKSSAGIFDSCASHEYANKNQVTHMADLADMTHSQKSAAFRDFDDLRRFFVATTRCLRRAAIRRRLRLLRCI